MTIDEKIAEVVNDYVSSNGTATEMDTEQLYKLVSAVYPIKKSSFIPSDYCYNRANKGISFDKHVHLFERTAGGKYLLLGEEFAYSGPVFYREKGETSDSILGRWTAGVFTEGKERANDIGIRLKNLEGGLRKALVNLPLTVNKVDEIIEIKQVNRYLCSVHVGTEVYKIDMFSSEWKTHTSYYCEQTEEGIFYYLDTLDECIGEVQRLLVFEIDHGSQYLKR